MGALTSVFDRLTTNLQSGRVLATMAGIGLVVLLTGYLVRRAGARLPVVVAAAAVPALLATAVLAAPYFQQDELDEALPMPEATATSPSTTTTQLATASLRGLGGHGATGTVALHQLPDGSQVLRFEEVDIEGTPTPRVYLVPGRDQERPDGEDLGELRAERGSFNYMLDTTPPTPVTVLVWCERFAVPIAGGTFG